MRAYYPFTQKIPVHSARNYSPCDDRINNGIYIDVSYIVKDFHIPGLTSFSSDANCMKQAAR